MKSWAIIHCAFATILISLATSQRLHAEPKLVSRSERHMGTVATIKLYAEDDAAAQQALDAAFQRIAQLDAIMSDYDESSELCRLSTASPTAAPVKVSDDLWRVFQLSQQISTLSDGAFDITVGPLTKLWRRSRRQRELPTPERLAEALAAVGYKKLQLLETDRSVKLQAARMRLDLGGIGQGFAADEALRELRKRGFSRALVDISGDIVMGEPPPGTTGWQTGIAPLEADAAPSVILRLANCAVSTSGDAFQFIEINGQRFSHIVDPQTGLGLARRSSVTVIAPDCGTADALATAVCVLGPQRGLEMIERRAGVSALVVFQENGKTTTVRSQRFPRH